MANKLKVRYSNIHPKEVRMEGKNLISVGTVIISPHTVVSVGPVEREISIAPSVNVGFRIKHLQGTSKILSMGIEPFEKWGLDSHGFDKEIKYGFDVNEAFDDFVRKELKAFKRMRAEFVALLDAALERKP